MVGFASQAMSDIASLKVSIAKSDSEGIDTPKTTRLLTLAELAFGRGEFENAAGVLKEALLTYSVETKGAFNTGFFVVQNSVSLTLLAILSILGIFVVSLYARRGYLLRKENRFGASEDLLLSMIKDLQKACFVENKLSMSEYQTSLSQYETRLSEAVEGIINVQNELTNMFSFKSRVTKLVEERGKLYDSIRGTQKQYFKEGLIESRVYEAKLKSLTKRLSQVEKDITYHDAMKSVHLNSSKVKIFWKLYYKTFK